MSDDDLHPVRTKQYLLPTPAIEAAFSELIRVINLRSPGLIIHGDYRGGKTRFCRWCIRALADELFIDGVDKGPKVFRLICERHKKSPTETRHLKWMLKKIGYEIAARDDLERKEQLQDYLIQEGRKSYRKQIVLIFDEAQELWFDQWSWLMDTHNALEDAGITPTFIFVGQPELKGTRDSFAGTNLEQIVQRFLVSTQELGGVSSPTECEEWLGCFDEFSAGIADDGLPFPEHFFPTAVRRGWKLRTIGKDLYRCFQKAVEDAGLAPRQTIRTKYFFNTVECLLIGQGNKDVVIPEMGDDALLAAIEQSGYLKSLSRADEYREDDADDVK